MTRHAKAFTLLELLLSLAVIAIIASLLIVSMRSVRAAAARTDSLGALRQMAVAYTGYSTDNRQYLLPGYIDATLFAAGRPFQALDVTVKDGIPLDPLDCRSYVWRLAPWVDNAWETFFTEAEPSVLAACQADYLTNNYFGPASPSSAVPLGISERPTYGLNSVYLGGDSVHCSDFTDNNPWTGTNPKIAAVRVSEVKNPTRVIVFAPTALADPVDFGDPDFYQDPGVGYCELRPPLLPADPADPDPKNGQWKHQQWRIDPGTGLVKMSHNAYGTDAGLLIDRTGGRRVPLVHLDGSGTVEEIVELSLGKGHLNARGLMDRWSALEIPSIMKEGSGSPFFEPNR